MSTSPLRILAAASLISLVLPGCFGKDDTSDPAEGDTDTDTDTDTDSDTDTDPESFPSDPSPFTVSVSGAYSGDLVFDTPTCYYPKGSSQLRVFWRNGSGAHVFFLMVELLSGFEGEGTYDETMGLRAKLQEEAGGYGYYFASDSSAGDTVSMTVSMDEEEHVWGEWSVSGMRDNHGGIVTLDPSVIPIWCPELN